MIKISDLQSLAPQANTAVLDSIEEHIDSAIRRHAAAGRPWPLAIPSTRSGWSSTDVESVLVKYRAEGWSAMLGGRSGVMCVVAPTERDCSLQRALVDAQVDVASAIDSAGPDDIVIGGKGEGPVVLDETPDMEPGWEDRAVERARREGVI